MKVYQFTLVLKNVDEQTINLEDSLYESGCDDGLINFRNHTVYIDFDREAENLEQAVLSAIKNVESSSVGAVVAYVAPEDLVSESEIAKRMHVKRQTVSLWIKGERRKEQVFPNPVMKLADKSPLWKWREVTEWLYKNSLITEKEIVDNAYLLENVNAVLEERDQKILRARQGLLKKINHININI